MDASAFLPVKKLTLPDSIVEQIRTMIVEGRIKPGDPLPSERDLAAKMCVSRTAVREALKGLTSMGVLVRTPRGTSVAADIRTVLDRLMTYALALGHRDYVELLEARRFLDTECAGLAAKRITPEELEALRDIMSQMRASVDEAEKFVHANVDFHKAVVMAAKNKTLYLFFSHVYELLNQFQRDITSHALRLRSVEHHEKILNAISKGHSAQARSAMRNHLSDVEGAYFSPRKAES